MFSKLINWVKGKPSNKQPEFHQNYPHSEPLDELIEYLLKHKDECQVLDNDGYWITIALDRSVTFREERFEIVDVFLDRALRYI